MLLNILHVEYAELLTGTPIAQNHGDTNLPTISRLPSHLQEGHENTVSGRQEDKIVYSCTQYGRP